MNMTHPHILEAERHGMPDPEPVTTRCPTCDRTVRQTDIFNCAHCGRKICRRCLYTNDTFMEHFCSEEISVYPSAETVRIPSDCYHQWCLDQMCLWQDKYFKLKQTKAA